MIAMILWLNACERKNNHKEEIIGLWTVIKESDSITDHLRFYKSDSIRLQSFINDSIIQTLYGKYYFVNNNEYLITEFPDLVSVRSKIVKLTTDSLILDHNIITKFKREH